MSAPEIVVRQELEARGIDTDLLLVSPVLAELIADLIEERDRENEIASALMRKFADQSEGGYTLNVGDDEFQLTP